MGKSNYKFFGRTSHIKSLYTPTLLPIPMKLSVKLHPQMLTGPVEFSASALEFGGKAMPCASSSYKNNNAAGYVLQSFKGNVDTPEHTKVLLLLHSLEVLLVRRSYARALYVPV